MRACYQRQHQFATNHTRNLLTYILELAARRKYQPMASHHATFAGSPYESDTTESKQLEDDEDRLPVRNVSQQCSLECSSELEESTAQQMASERSEHNLSDISELALSRSTNDDGLAGRRSSVDESSAIERDPRAVRHR